jgi:hypothetical protein
MRKTCNTVLSGCLCAVWSCKRCSPLPFLVIFLALLFAPFNAEGAYRVYLKSGRIISGIEEAVEGDETIQIFKNGITLQLQKTNVEKVEAYDMPEPEEVSDTTPGTAAEIRQPEYPVADIEQQKAREQFEILKREKMQARYDEVNEELKKIEELEKRSQELRRLGRKKWSPRKARLARQEKAEIDKRLEALKDEKAELLKEKKDFESRIKQ